jgi:hypothetical protein
MPHHSLQSTKAVQPQYVLGPDGRCMQVYHHWYYGDGIPGERFFVFRGRRISATSSRRLSPHIHIDADGLALLPITCSPASVHGSSLAYFARTVTPMTTADSSSSLLGCSMRSGYSMGGTEYYPSHPTGGDDKG